MLGYMSSDIATIAAWRTATGQDLNSLSADPVFLGVSDLHSFSSVLNAHGVPVSSVTDDFNGTIRNATTPDIGAYEFEIAAKNLGILAIIQPSSSCALTANEHIAIRLKNFGSAQIDTAQVYYKINNGTVVHEQMIHPILPDSVYVYTFAAAADFSVPGHYVVKSYIHVVHDTNFINDTINNYNIDAGVNLNYGPYTMGFEPTDDMSLWTKLDVNADGSTWVFPVTYNMHNGANAAQVNTSFNTGNDWLFSRCFKFTSGNTYKIEFWYRADYAGSPQNLDLKMGTDNNPTAMTTNLITLASFDSTVYQKASATFVPTTTGTYYFGWWGHSSSMYSSAYIDDINISLIPPQEASMSKIVTPNSGCGLTATEPISIIIKNTGLNVINANLITAHYKINNAATVNQLVSTAINANDSLLFVFTQTANLHVTTRLVLNPGLHLPLTPFNLMIVQQSQLIHYILR
jgi:hypothetical protein